VIWDRWRRRAEPERAPAEAGPFDDLLEEAPVTALLLDAGNTVVAMNEAAAAFFSAQRSELPKGLIEVTREGALLEVLRGGRAETEIELVHSRRAVQVRLVPGPASGDTLMFITDVTELRRLERIRQEFVANLSHELKTPVTALRLAIESLEVSPAAADSRRFVQRALDEADHLTAVIENLRKLASLEAGEVRADIGDVAVAETVEEVVQRLRIQPRTRVEVDPSLTVRADRQMLSQALANLLDNAVRFAPDEGDVVVVAAEEGDEVVVSVRDRGPGIAPEHWERVFERFYKVDPARTRQTGGTGLGLAITKHLVHAQGGRIWTEAAPESGQVFSMALAKGRPGSGHRNDVSAADQRSVL
jgi:two-component system, OmpR family, phosphate regulon sensor histidine kinase PhoR